MNNNSLTFGGTLQPLIEKLEQTPLIAGHLIGQEIILDNIKKIQAIIALDSSNNIHLLLSPPIANETIFSNIDLKGLKIGNMEWSVAGMAQKSYLDVSCETGPNPLFKRPFLKFAEDVLYELTQSESAPENAVYKTCTRWKKFWSPDSGAEITREWVHGLFGELLFLKELTNKFGPEVINNWVGPLGKDHDFQTGNELAAEVKTSIEVPVRINCNIRQLDSELFKKLYIVCYNLTPSETGSTLTQLVKEVEELIKNNEIMLDKFYELLTTAGYSRQSESEYDKYVLNYGKASVYQVNNDFPKIVEKSFSTPPDHRISGIRYTLQLTGLEELTIKDVENDLEKFNNL